MRKEGGGPFAGEAKLGVNFSLSDNTAVPNNPQIAQFSDFDDVVFAGNQVECTSGASTFTGQGGCLAATMTLNNTQLQGPLGIEIDLNPPDVDATFPTDLEQQLLNAFLNYDMLFEGLKEKGSMIIVPSSALETMNLGAMGGLAALGKLREIDPAVKAIVSSGYSSDPVMANYRAHGFVAMVAKPYETHEISRVLREVLTGA